MTRRSNGTSDGVSYKPEINKEKLPSQKFMEEFLNSNSKDKVQIEKQVGYIFHWLVIVDDINIILAQLNHAKLLEGPESQALQKIKQDCISEVNAMEQSLALPEEIRPYLLRLEEAVSAEVEASSVETLAEEEVNKIKEGAKEAVYKAITMNRLIAKFVADGTSLPIIQTVKGSYTAPIKITIKDSCHPDNLLIVHIKVLPTDQPKQEDELPVICHGISDEWTFRRYPWLKGKIPHSSYTLFPCSLDGEMDDGRCIIELRGMEKIEGLNLVDEDLSEEDAQVMATVLQSGARSHEQISFTEVMKAQNKAGKKQ